MGQFTHNGVVYEELPGGKVRVVGHAGPIAGAAPIGGADPMIPLDVTGKGLSNQTAGVNARVNTATEAAQIREANAKASKAQNEAGVVATNPAFDREKDLRSAFESQPAVQAYKDAATSLGIMLQTPDTGGGDIQIIYNYIKSQGPGPVAQGELDLAQSVASFQESLEQKYGKLTSSNRLPARVRRELIEASRQAVAVKRAQFDQVYSQFRTEAARNGLNAEAVTGRHPADAVRPAEEKYIRDAGGQPKSRFRSNELEMNVGDDGIPEIVLHQENHPDSPGQKRLRETDAFGAGLVGFTDAMTLGLSDEAAAGLNAFGGSLMGKGSFGDLYDRNLETERGYQDDLFNRNPYASMAGQVAGSVTGLGATSGLLRNAGRLSPLATRGTGIGADILYGAGYGAGSGDENRLGGAAKGAAAAAGGNLLGSKVVAPAFRGVASKMGFNPAPALPAGDSLITRQTIKAKASDVLGRLDEASQTQMPFALVDAAPQLRALGGSVVRKSPDAFALGHQQLGNRTLGQADRLTGIVEGELGPRLNIPTFKEGVKKSAQAQSRPLYESAKAQGPVDDAQIVEMLGTPAGQRAARSGYDEALNNGEPVGDMVEEVDSITGQLRLVGRPSWNVLQRMKFALDEMPDQTNLARRFNSRLGTLNPDFKKANLAYAKEMRRGDIAEAGYNAASPNVKAPELGASLATPKNMKDPALYRQGYGSNLVDKVRGMRDSANPYEVASVASPDQLAKMEMLSPQLASKFGKARQIEADMALTNRELFGGSPTQPRAEADKLFDTGGLAGDALELGLAVGTGAPPISAMRSQLFGGRFGMSALRDAYQMGVGKSAKQRADQLAPTLFNPNPDEVAPMLAEMIRRQALRDAYVQRTGMFGAGLGAPVAISLTGR